MDEMNTSITLLALWFGPPPEPHLWIGLSNPRYAVREACGQLILHDPRQRWWILRGTLIGSAHTRDTCTRMLEQLYELDHANVFRCPLCEDGLCFKARWYTSSPICNNCGLPEDGHEVGKRCTCLNCRGAGWILR